MNRMGRQRSPEPKEDADEWAIEGEVRRPKRKTSEEKANETWDFVLMKHSKAKTVTPVGDKAFHYFLNRGNTFGKCKHENTLRLLEMKESSICVNCSSIIPNHEAGSSRGNK